MRLGSPTTPQRTRLNGWPGSFLTLQGIYIYIYIHKKFKTEQSPGKVVATFFFDVCGVLLVGFTAHLSTINAAAYQETLKRLKETIRQKKTGCWPQEFFFCTTIIDVTVRLQPRIS
jgi:hypothetical protein